MQFKDSFEFRKCQTELASEAKKRGSLSQQAKVAIVQKWTNRWRQRVSCSHLEHNMFRLDTRAALR